MIRERVEASVMALIRKPRCFDGDLEWFNNGVQDVLGVVKPSCYCTGRVTACSREDGIALYEELFPEPEIVEEPVVAGDIQNHQDIGTYIRHENNLASDDRVTLANIPDEVVL